MDLKEHNIQLLQKNAALSSELANLKAEKNILIAIVNSDCPPPSDYSDLGVWIDEMAKDFAKEPPVGNTEFSMWLHDWLCNIRAARQAGVVPDEGDDIDA